MLLLLLLLQGWRLGALCGSGCLNPGVLLLLVALL
jgi:hypothetical protein